MKKVQTKAHKPSAYIETILMDEKDQFDTSCCEVHEWAGSQPIDLPPRPADRKTAKTEPPLTRECV